MRKMKPKERVLSIAEDLALYWEAQGDPQRNQIVVVGMLDDLREAVIEWQAREVEKTVKPFKLKRRASR